MVHTAQPSRRYGTVTVAYRIPPTYLQESDRGGAKVADPSLQEPVANRASPTQRTVVIIGAQLTVIVALLIVWSIRRNRRSNA